jgi:hypothetical protein
MPLIEYVGLYDSFNVPLHNIPDTPARTPFEVSQAVADDLLTQTWNFRPVIAADESGKDEN